MSAGPGRCAPSRPHVRPARLRWWPAVAAGVVAAAGPHAARPARAEDLLAQYSATDRFRSGQPRAFAVTPDGRDVLFLRSGPRDRVGDL